MLSEHIYVPSIQCKRRADICRGEVPAAQVDRGTKSEKEIGASPSTPDSEKSARSKEMLPLHVPCFFILDSAFASESKRRCEAAAPLFSCAECVQRARMARLLSSPGGKLEKGGGQVCWLRRS